MNLEEELKEELKEELRLQARANQGPPEGLEDAIWKKRQYQKSRPGKKWVVAGILSAVLALPTGVYAGYTHLADAIYGSKEKAEEIGLNPERYEDLERRLADAEQSLPPADFAEFMELLHHMGGLVLKYGSGGQTVDPALMSEGDYENYLQWTSQLKPLLHQLEKAEALRETDERAQYADSLLAMAKKKLNAQEQSAFSELVQAMQKYEAKMIGNDGEPSLERLSAEERKELDRLRDEIQPFFKKLGIETARD